MSSGARVADMDGRRAVSQPRATTKRRAERRAGLRVRRSAQHTRELLLAAAGKVLAQDGKAGLSVARVARLAGLDRGTAYMHFRTRAQLIGATAAWVSDQLSRAIFVEAATDDASPFLDCPAALITRLVHFAIENPAYGSVWLAEMQASQDRGQDRFWQQFTSSFQQFARTQVVRPRADAEVVCMILLAAIFTWPRWRQAHALAPAERRVLAEGFAGDLLRLAAVFGAER